MLKKTLLALTALSAISLLPYTVATPAGAAVKIKPAAVKIKAKIKPKIRAAKVRVRPKAKVRVKAAKVRIKKRVKVRAAKVRPVKLKRARVNVKAVKVKPKAKPKLKVKLARKAPQLKPVKLTKPLKVSTKAPRPSAKPGKKVGQIAIIGSKARFAKNAINAARAAEAARNVIGLGDRRAAAPGLSLATPDLTNTGQAHRTLTPPLAGQNNGIGGNGRGLGPNGAGVGSLGGLENSHSRQAPSTSWVDVNPANAKDGVANQGGGTVRLPVYNRKENRRDTLYHADTSSPGTAEHMVVRNHSDETSTAIHTVHGELDGNTITKTRVTETDANGHSTETERPVEVREIPESERTTELRNPDYAGGSTCQNISCIIGGEEPKGLSFAETKTGASPGGLPPAPEDANHTGQPTTPLFTANDVLERYDPDSTDQGGGGSAGKTAPGPGGFPEDPNG